MMNYVSENQKQVMHQWLLENRRFGSSFQCKYYENIRHQGRRLVVLVVTLTDVFIRSFAWKSDSPTAVQGL